MRQGAPVCIRLDDAAGQDAVDEGFVAIGANLVASYRPNPF
jgi:hypothetical protein